MSIEANDLVFIKSRYINDTGSNGGVIGTVRIVSNSLNNVFPNITYLERTNGIVRYRKVFLKNENPTNIVLESAKLYISNINSGEDYFSFAIGTDSDQQQEADDYQNWYGTGRLVTGVISGETQIEVQYKNSYGVFSGENIQIRLDNGTNYEFRNISGEISWVGTNATINLAEPLDNSYGSADTIVSSVALLGDIKPSIYSWVKTSSAGDYDIDSFPFQVFNIGTVNDDWTLTFITPTTFTVVGAVTGNVGTGTISSTFAPANGSSYYFSIDKNGWLGTWAVGDKIVFSTTHAAIPIWLKEDILAGCPAQSNNLLSVVWEGESI